MTKEDTEIEVLPVPAPTMGIIGNIPTTMLNPRACVDCNNVVFKDGIVSTRTGYVAYATSGLLGIPLLFFRYQKWNGYEYEMLVTTTNVYHNYFGTWTSIKGSLSGTVNARATMAYIENYLTFSNGVDAPSKWDGDSWTALNASHSGDAIDWGDYRPLILLPFHFRLVGFNDNKVTTGAAIRIMYSRAGDFDRIDHEEYSGYIEMTQGMGASIIGAAPLKNYVGVYKDYCCALLSYIGGASTFAINVQIEGIGLAAKDAIAVVGTSHLFLGSDLNIYRWNGGTELEPIGNPIKKLLRAEVNRAMIDRSFAIFNREQRQVIFFLPIDAHQFPTRMWIYNLDDESWSKGTIAEMAAGNSLTTSNLEKTLLGYQGASDFADWYFKYDCDELLTTQNGWIPVGTAEYASVAGGILTIDNEGHPTTCCGFLRHMGIDLQHGFTFQFNAQITYALGDFPFYFVVYDGVHNLNCSLYMTASAVYLGDTKICDFDTTNDYHVYRVSTYGTTATLYIDGAKKGSHTMTAVYGTSAIAFGNSIEVGGSAITINIDYVYWGFGSNDGDDEDGGLDDPETGTTAVKYYDYAALDDDGDTIESNFETGDFVLDKVEHLIRNRRFYGLGLDLKGYSTSSRLTLEFSLDEGVTWDTLDKTEESLTAVYALYNWDFMQTTRKIRFKFSDDTASQKWYLRFFGIKQKEGERV